MEFKLKLKKKKAVREGQGTKQGRLTTKLNPINDLVTNLTINRLHRILDRLRHDLPVNHRGAESSRSLSAYCGAQERSGACEERHLALDFPSMGLLDWMRRRWNFN